MAQHEMKVDDGAYGQRTVKMDFPSNSHQGKNEKKDDTKKRRVERVTTGRVTSRKKPLGKRIVETFMGDNVESVGSYVLHDVLIPGAKAMICDMVGWGGFAEMMLFGGESRVSRTRNRGNGGRSFISYGNFYDDRGKRDDRRTMSPQNRAIHDFSDIILESKGEAEEVLNALIDLIEEYGCARVSDLYVLVGITSDHPDQKYGWENLSRAETRRVRDGYLLDLPKPIVLD